MIEARGETQFWQPNMGLKKNQVRQPYIWAAEGRLRKKDTNSKEGGTEED